MDYNARLSAYRESIDTYLEKLFKERLPQSRLLEAMRYSLLAPGKRIRPVLTLEFCRAAGGQAEAALPLAAAVELVHTYSLIHDDLPCMDDDDLRRGRPTNHIIYGEALAVLAGDALLSSAFRLITEAEKLSDRQKLESVAVLSQAAGEGGMVGGQSLDIELDDPGERDMFYIHRLKTCELIKAAGVLGCIAGGGGENQMDAAKSYGDNLGMAFQIMDDILDEVGDAETLGKSTSSDIKAGKTTFMGWFGLETSREMVKEYSDNAVSALSRGEFTDSGFLVWLAGVLTKREK